MTSRDFAYWLQGFFEITNPSTINTDQTDMIKRHLNMVFKHEIDPSMGDAKHNKELTDIHEGAIKINTALHGTQPSPKHEYSSLHGWYDPEHEVPRC